MKKCSSYSVLCTLLLAGALYHAHSAEADNASANRPLSREDTVLVNVTASVEAIDYTNREVTLKGPLGNKVTFSVDQRVKRLNEVKVGDLVSADYYVSVAAELRKPTPEEEKEPLVALGVKGKAPPGTSPAAGGLRQYRRVTNVEGF